MTGGASTTLTTRFAAIQLKMLHLQFRMKKIYQDQKMLSEGQHGTSRDSIRGLLPAGYTFIDMLVSLEHASQLVRDIFATPELRTHFDRDTLEILNRTRKTCSAPGFLDSGLTVFASTLPRPARRGHVAPERDFDSGISPASTARCTFA